MRGKRKNLKRAIEVGAIILAVITFISAIMAGVAVAESKATYEPMEVTTQKTSEPVVTTGNEIYSYEVESIGDPNNYLYPYNTMSADWGVEVYEQGFKYYQIPDDYAEYGGCLPEVVQVYLWCLCEERGLDYYTVVALIERESGYRWDALGDNGNSYGYCQVQKKWHLERMEEENVQDLMDPYGNLRVATNYLVYLQDKYGSSGTNCVLMAYNMGETRARELWKDGTYSSNYSRGILQRAEEIKQELQD